MEGYKYLKKSMMVCEYVLVSGSVWSGTTTGSPQFMLF